MGPTKRKPRRFSSLLSAVDSGVIAGRSSSAPRRAPPAGRRVRPDQLGQRLAGRVHLAAAAVAFWIAASIFPRWRTMPASASSRSTSRSPNAATASMSKPANAARKFSRLRRIVSHDRPDWKPSSTIRS